MSLSSPTLGLSVFLAGLKQQQVARKFVPLKHDVLTPVGKILTSGPDVQNVPYTAAAHLVTSNQNKH
jgi:hypothetical protein